MALSSDLAKTSRRSVVRHGSTRAGCLRLQTYGAVAGFSPRGAGDRPLGWPARASGALTSQQPGGRLQPADREGESTRGIVRFRPTGGIEVVDVQLVHRIYRAIPSRTTVLRSTSCCSGLTWTAARRRSSGSRSVGEAHRRDQMAIDRADIAARGQPPAWNLVVDIRSRKADPQAHVNDNGRALLGKRRAARPMKREQTGASAQASRRRRPLGAHKPLADFVVLGS
jgi:hypothetical protein